MRIYYADIRGLDEAQAKFPAMSGSRGSAFGTSLLAIAYEEYNDKKMPRLKKLTRGKPYFPGNEGFHFSISHSRTHVICVVSEKPVGIDTLDHRKISPETVTKLTTKKELEQLSFYEIWALREAFFKLTGRGDLRTLRFFRENGRITPPESGVCCRLYDEVEDSSVAVCAYEDAFPEKLVKIEPERLLRDKNKLDRKLDEFYGRQ